MADRVKVGLIGCGNIAPAYIKGCGQFPILEVAACADMLPDRAQAFAAEHGLQALTVEGLLSDPTIDIVINLTVPQAHAEVSMKVIAAGKHVHSEKPLALNRDDGRRLLDAAREAGVRVGCAPDTFLGGGLQTCRQVIEQGVIGQPVAATAFMGGRGPESWHPNPEFFYKAGGGPLFDMGPYYLTALIHLLGPIQRLSGAARISFPERIATSEARYGERIAVDVATHIAGTLEFTAGPLASFVTSFDIHKHSVPRIEIYGSEGTMHVPDPNTFGGPVKIWTAEEREWREVPLTHSADVGRGIGVADMAHAIQASRAHRASGELAYHVLDVMQAFDEVSASGQYAVLDSQCDQPAPLPVGLTAGQF